MNPQPEPEVVLNRQMLNERVLTAREIFHLCHLQFELYTTDCRKLLMRRFYKWKRLSPASLQQNVIPSILKIGQEIWENFGSQLQLSTSQTNLLVNGHLAQWDVNLIYTLLQHIKCPGLADEEENATLWQLKQIEHNIYDRRLFTMSMDEFYNIHWQLIPIKNQLGFKLPGEAEIMTRFLYTVTPLVEAVAIVNRMLTGINLLEARNYQLALYFLTQALNTNSLGRETRKHFLRLRMTHLNAHQSQCVYFHQAVAKDALEILGICNMDPQAHHLLFNYLKRKGDLQEPFEAIYHFHKFTGCNIIELFGCITRIVLDLVSNQPWDEKKVLLMKTARGLSDTDNVINHILTFKQFANTGCPIGKFAYCTCALLFFDETENSNNSAVQITQRLYSLNEIANEETRPIVIGKKAAKAQNSRVAFCQFVIGLLYQTGNHVEMNLNAAEQWYKKAATLHGNYLAAFNLGYIYYEGGRGIRQNLELAKQYWKLAVAQGYVHAYSALAILYLRQLDILQAKELIVKASQFRTDPENIVKRWLLPRIFDTASQNWLTKTIDLGNMIEENFEKPLKLSKKGMTFMDRVHRADILGFRGNIKNFLDETTSQFKLMPTLLHEVDENHRSSYTILTDTFPGKQNTREEFVPVMNILLGDAKIAYNFIKSKYSFSIQDQTFICTILYSILEGCPTISHGLYLCQFYSFFVQNRIIKVMRDILTVRETCVVLKIKALFCLAIFGLNMGFRREPRQLIQQIISYHPTNPLYKIANLEFFLGESITSLKEALIDVTAYLLEFPKQPTLQYLCADLHFKLAMRILEQNQNPEFIEEELLSAVTGFQTCLYIIPLESPLYPLASYGIACSYIQLFSCVNPRKQIVTNIQKNMETFHEYVVEYYKLGLRSEQHQLPWFPQSPSVYYLKFKVEIYINKKQGHLSLYDEICKLNQLNGGNCHNYFIKPYLLSPLRIYHVTSFRHKLKKTTESKVTVLYEEKKLGEIQMSSGANRLVLSTSETSRVTYDGSNALIKLTIIEDLSIFKTITMLAEDNDGNTVYVKLNPNEFVWRVNPDLKLEFGTKMAIVNPSYGVKGCFGDNCINVGIKKDGMSKIILLEKVSDMCRFCGEPDATRACSNLVCGYRYCGDQCMEKDVKFMNHEYTCGIISPSVE